MTERVTIQVGGFFLTEQVGEIYNNIQYTTQQTQLS